MKYMNKQYKMNELKSFYQILLLYKRTKKDLY